MSSEKLDRIKTVRKLVNKMKVLYSELYLEASQNGLGDDIEVRIQNLDEQIAGLDRALDLPEETELLNVLKMNPHAS
jgi:hypothetical protein